MTDIFTEEHRQYINKQITKALKTIDYESIVREVVEKEFDDLYESCRLSDDIKSMVTQVIYEHLVKCGLLEGSKESEDE